MTLRTFKNKLSYWLAEERIESYQISYQNDTIRVYAETIIPIIMIEKLAKLCRKYELTFYITIDLEQLSPKIVIYKSEIK